MLFLLRSLSVPLLISAFPAMCCNVNDDEDDDVEGWSDEDV